MKQILLLVLIFYSANCWSDIYIDCDSNSKRVSDVPELLSESLHVSCTSYGQIVEANRNWAMINLMSQSAFFIPSQIAMDPKARGNRSYFKSIKARKLSVNEVRSKYGFITALFEEEIKMPQKGHVITLNNNLDLEQKMYLFDNGISYLCSPVCKEGNIFMLQNINQQSIYH